jgi:hypothetical protein
MAGHTADGDPLPLAVRVAASQRADFMAQPFWSIPTSIAYDLSRKKLIGTDLNEYLT